MIPSRYRSLLPALLLLLAGMLAFGPGLGGRFLFDDYANIVSNPRVHMETLDLDSLRNAMRGFEPGSYGRPLATLSFALDHYVGGRNPLPYKVSSLLVHLFNALMVLLLSRRLLDLAWPGRENGWAALAVASAWAVHPLQVSSVLYVVQRMETLSLSFVLVALLAYLRGRNAQIDGRRGGGWLALSGLLAAIGLLSKETAALFPVYTLALELTVLGFMARDPRTTRNLKLLYGAGVLVALLIFAFLVVPHYADPARYLSRDFTLVERLLSQLRVLPMYLGWMLLPLPDHLLFYYDQIEPSRGLFTPWTTAAGGLLLLALLATAIGMWRRAPLMALGVFWCLGAHLITSNVIPLELAFEHRNYFSLLGALLVLTDGIVRLPARDGPAIVRTGVGAIVLGLLVLCMIRSATWGNPLLLASDMAQRNPMSARAANDVGEQYMLIANGNADSPFYSLAQHEFSRGAALPRASILPEQALLLMAATSGKTADPAWWDSLVRKLETRPISPQDGAGVVGLVRHRSKGIELDDERLAEAYVVLVRRRPQPPSILATFADHALTKANDPDLAERLFVEAVERSVDDPEYMAQIAGVLTQAGHTRHAEAVIAAAARLGVQIH